MIWYNKKLAVCLLLLYIFIEELKCNRYPNILHICAHCHLPSNTISSTFALDSISCSQWLCIINKSYLLLLSWHTVLFSFFWLRQNKPPQTSYPSSATAPLHGMPSVLEHCLLSYGIVWMELVDLKLQLFAHDIWRADQGVQCA